MATARCMSQPTARYTIYAVAYHNLHVFSAVSWSRGDHGFNKHR